MLDLETFDRRFQGDVLLPAAAEHAAATLWFPNPVQLVAPSGVGTLMTIKLPFVNRGPHALRPRVANVSCGCSAVQAPSAAVPPGATGELVVEFRVPAWGDSIVAIDVETGDPSIPRATCALSVHMPDLPRPDPSQLRIKTTQWRAQQRTFRVLLPPGGRVAGSACSLKWVSAELLPPVIGAPQVTSQPVRLVVTPGEECGEFSSQLTVQLSGCEMDYLQIPLAVTVGADIFVTPTTGFLGTVASGSYARCVWHLTSRSGRAFAIQSVPPPSRDLKVVAQVGERLPTHRILCSVLAGGDPGRVFERAATLRLDSGEKHVLRMVGRIAEGQGDPLSTRATATPGE